jgi:hypothetical protein
VHGWRVVVDGWMGGWAGRPPTPTCCLPPHSPAAVRPVPQIPSLAVACSAACCSAAHAHRPPLFGCWYYAQDKHGLTAYQLAADRHPAVEDVLEEYGAALF